MQRSRPLPALREGLGKKDIAALADRSVEQVLEEGQVFQVAEALAAMEAFVKSVRSDERYVQLLRDELAKHHGTVTTASGARIEMCEAGVRYDYTHSSEWRRVAAEIEALTEKKKQIEEQLRRPAPGRMLVDTETGEVIEGALKTSRSTYRITLPK